MKKKSTAAMALLLAAVIGASAWFWGYHHRKSNDNLPALTAIAQMSESEVNSLLPGYKIHQLHEVWGEPDLRTEGTDCWQIGHITLMVSYKSNGLVVVCGLKDPSGASVGEGP